MQTGYSYFDCKKMIIYSYVMYLEARELIFKNQLDHFCHLLNSHDIPFLLFKGSALAYDLYENPILRPRIDTDVLISPELRAKTEHLLVTHGYSLIPNQSALLGQASYFKKIHQMTLIFDLHWQLFAPIPLRSLFSFSELWSERKKISHLNAYTVDDSSALILAGVHWVGHHLLHPEPHWISDVQLLANNRSPTWWDDFKNRCQVKGVQGILDQVFKASQIASPWSPLEIRRANEPLSYYLSLDRTLFSDFLMDLKFLKGKERISYLKFHFFPDYEFIKEKSGSSFSKKFLFFFYLKRIFKGLRKTLKPR